MKTVVPDYYSGFACLMGECTHSCCRGWEIDVDEEALKRFGAVSGEFGEKLRRSIAVDDEGARYILDEEERCPFLQPDGLCEMMLKLGPDSVCDICADHPRFRSFFSDRTELGLGLSCEAVGALILGRKEKFDTLVLEDDGEAEETDEFETEVTEYRGGLIAMALDRLKPVTERVKEIESAAGVEEADIKALAEYMLSLECIEPEWREKLAELGEKTPAPADGAAGADDNCEEHGEPDKYGLSFEQLLVYLLYRHLPAALEEEYSPQEITAFCTAMWRLVRALFENTDKSMNALVQLCRQWSAEIEYSDENPQLIIGWLARDEDDA